MNSVEIRWRHPERTFQDGRGLQDLLLDPGVLTADGGEELQDQLRALRLPSTRLTAETQTGTRELHCSQPPGGDGMFRLHVGHLCFQSADLSPDDATLVLVVTLHVEVTVVGDGEYVRRHLADLLVGVEADLVRSVDGEQLVGVDRHQDGACVRLQEDHKQDWMFKTLTRRQNIRQMRHVSTALV